jgi:glycosyltransferase involved in cell wall biosynthesis
MKHLRVFWLLVGDKNTGSSRIHGHNIHNEFIKKGIFSKILKQGIKPFSIREMIWLVLNLKKGDLLILQKRKEFSLIKILRLLKLKGVSIAFIDCDLPVCNPSLVDYFDFIICTSEKLYELYSYKYPTRNITYIPDAVEYNKKEKIEFEKKAIYFGWLTESRLEKIESLKNLFKNIDWELLTMSNSENADIIWKNWQKKETYEIISKYGVSIIPVDDNESSKYKSANRVLQSLALGNIVLCGDIEAYRNVIISGVNGFICSDMDDWTKALTDISDETRRLEIIEKGYDTAQRFTLDKIILSWISFLKL